MHVILSKAAFGYKILKNICKIWLASGDIKWWKEMNNTNIDDMIILCESKYNQRVLVNDKFDLLDENQTLSHIYLSECVEK